MIGLFSVYRNMSISNNGIRFAEVYLQKHQQLYKVMINVSYDYNKNNNYLLAAA